MGKIKIKKAQDVLENFQRKEIRCCEFTLKDDINLFNDNNMCKSIFGK